MSFRKEVLADNERIFLDTDYFSEIFTVLYDGEIIENVPAVLDAISESARAGRGRDDHIQGLSEITHTLTCESKLFCRRPPRPGEQIQLEDAEGKFFTYYVETCEEDFGLCDLYLKEVRG